jgi:hypothetical protein
MQGSFPSFDRLRIFGFIPFDRLRTFGFIVLPIIPFPA